MTRFIKIILYTFLVLVLCLGTYLFMTKQKTISKGVNNDLTEYLPDTSYIYMPVTLSMNGLLTGINERMPDTLMNKSFTFSGTTINILMKRKGDVTSSLDSSILRVKFPFTIDLKMNSGSSNSILSLLTKLDPITLNQELNMALPISINQDLKLTTIKEAIDIDWNPLPDLDIPGLDFNLQKVIETEILSEGGILYEYLIKETLERFNLTEYLAASWHHFQMEIPMANIGEGFILNSTPVDLTAWYAGGKYDSLFVGLKIGAIFNVNHESELKEKVTFSLPDNIGIENVSHINDTSTFSVKVNLPIKVMNKLTLKYLQQTDWSYKGFKIKVDDVQFSNGKNTVYVSLKYSGNLRGEIVMKGTPYINPETRVFSLKNLGLQNKTTNILVSTADRVLNDFLVEKMQNIIHYDLGAAVDSLPRLFNNKLTDLTFEEGVEANVQQLRLDRVETHLTKNDIQIIVYGKSKFYLTPKHYNFDFEKILPN